MSFTETPLLGRRRFLGLALAATGGLALPVPLFAQGRRVPTPAQTAGPFYSTALPSDTDNDLVRLRGAEARASGTVTHIGGRVVTTDGRPVAGALLEIWQCDANGRYLHPGSGGNGPRDAAFQGFGRAVTAEDGSYSFRTIRPVPYPGRTPHIHFAVRPRAGEGLVTQMYVAGEPLNARDGLYRRLGRAGREAVTVRLGSANGIEEGALAGRFDIVLAA